MILTQIRPATFFISRQTTPPGDMMIGFSPSLLKFLLYGKFAAYLSSQQSFFTCT
jgi:hypothetical protein